MLGEENIYRCLSQVLLLFEKPSTFEVLNLRSFLIINPELSLSPYQVSS